MPATPAAADGPLSPDAIITRLVPLQLKRRGVELRLVVPGADAQMPKVDLVLLTAVGRASSLAAIAAQERISVRYVGRLIRLALLAPSIVELIARGRQPVELTAEMLTRREVLPPEWEMQKQLLAP